MTARTIRHAITATATARSSPTVLTRGRRRARTSDLMIRSPLLDGTPYLIVHPIPTSRDRTPGYRIGEDQSAGVRTSDGDPEGHVSIFAERDLWNVGLTEPTSLHLDVGGPDHFAPLLGFLGDEFCERGRCH